MKTYLEISNKEFNQLKRQMMEFYGYPKGSKKLSPSQKNLFTAHWYVGKRVSIDQPIDFNVLKVKYSDGSYLEIPLYENLKNN